MAKPAKQFGRTDSYGLMNDLHLPLMPKYLHQYEQSSSSNPRDSNFSSSDFEMRAKLDFDDPQYQQMQLRLSG